MQQKKELVKLMSSIRKKLKRLFEKAKWQLKDVQFKNSKEESMNNRKGSKNKNRFNSKNRE